MTDTANNSSQPDLSPLPGRSDDSFEHDGQITRAALRAVALARLRPAPGQRLWDVGLGSGAVAVEWCLAAPGATASGLERRTDRAERAHRNAERFGVDDRLTVHLGEALDQIRLLTVRHERPDAVFVGGGGSAEVLDACWEALRPGGRMVVHAVTLETEALLTELHRRHGGHLTRLHLEVAEPIGRFTGWKPARPIVQWAAERPDEAVTA